MTVLPRRVPLAALPLILAAAASSPPADGVAEQDADDAGDAALPGHPPGCGCAHCAFERDRGTIPS